MQKYVYLIIIRPLFLFGSASFFRSSVGMCCFTSILARLKKKKKKNYYMVSEDGELLSPHGAACEAAAFAQRPACALRAVSPFLFKKKTLFSRLRCVSFIQSSSVMKSATPTGRRRLHFMLLNFFISHFASHIGIASFI